MALQDIINDALTILNRDDCTSAMMQTFVLQGVERIQRECRLPSMEREMLVTTTGICDWVAVPSDLLQLVDILLPDEFQGWPKPLIKTPFRKLMRMDPGRWPSHYGRFQGQYWIRGQVQTAQLVQIQYYGQFTPWATLTSENELSMSSPDLAVYAALSYAGDQFQHPLTTTWESRYVQIRDSVIQAGADIENEGGPAAVSRMFENTCYTDWGVRAMSYTGFNSVSGIASPTGFFNGNASSSISAEDLQSALTAALTALGGEDPLVTTVGCTFVGPVLLSEDPQVPTEAATKNYCDNNNTALNALISAEVVRATTAEGPLGPPGEPQPHGPYQAGEHRHRQRARSWRLAFGHRSGHRSRPFQRRRQRQRSRGH